MNINSALISELVKTNIEYKPSMLAGLLGIDHRGLTAFIRESGKRGHFFELIREPGKSIIVIYHGHFPGLDISNPIHARIALHRKNPTAGAASVPMGA